MCEYWRVYLFFSFAQKRWNVNRYCSAQDVQFSEFTITPCASINKIFSYQATYSCASVISDPNYSIIQIEFMEMTWCWPFKVPYQCWDLGHSRKPIPLFYASLIHAQSHRMYTFDKRHVKNCHAKYYIGSSDKQFSTFSRQSRVSARDHAPLFPIYMPVITRKSIVESIGPSCIRQFQSQEETKIFTCRDPLLISISPSVSQMVSY